MPITLDDDGATLLDGNKPLLFPRDGNHSPIAFLGGLDDSDNTVLGRFTTDGKLRVDATVNPTGDVILKAYDSSNVLNPVHGVADPITGMFALLVNDPRLQFSSGALEVSVVNAASSGAANKFGTTSTLDGIWATVLTQTVLPATEFDIYGLNAWGDTDAEWAIYVGAAQVGGTRTSPSKLSDSVSYQQPIPVIGPATITVKVRHWSAGKTVDFYANLTGRSF